MPRLAHSLLAALVATSAAAQVHYAPTSARYHLRSVFHEIQRAQGKSGAYTVHNDQTLTLVLAGAGMDTLQFTATIDSIRMTSDGGIAMPNLNRLEGTQVNGTMSTTGAIYTSHATLPDSGIEAQTLVDRLTHFLPALPKNAKAGTAWTDSANSSLSRSGATLESKTVSHSKVLGDTTYRGQKAWRIERNSTLQLSGALTQEDQNITVQGSGTVQGMYYVGATGEFLGSTANQQMNLTRTIGPTVVAVEQKTTSTVEIVR